MLFMWLAFVAYETQFGRIAGVKILQNTQLNAN